MKKDIDKLTEQDVIHCPTRELFKKTMNLNSNNTLSYLDWDMYEQATCYVPYGFNSEPSYLPFYYSKENGYTIHNAEDFFINKDVLLYREYKIKQGLWIQQDICNKNKPHSHPLEMDLLSYYKSYLYIVGVDDECIHLEIDKYSSLINLYSSDYNGEIANNIGNIIDDLILKYK